MTTETPDTGTQPDAKTSQAGEPEKPSEEPTKDWQAEADKWKAQARKHEERAKANSGAAKELEELRKQSMGDQERAVAEAKAAGRADAIAEVGAERVDDAVRVASAGRDLDIDALLEGLDRSRFLDGDGRPDREAISAWVQRIAPDRSSSETGQFPDLGQGVRSGGDRSVALNGDPLLRDLKSKLGVR